MQVMEKNLASGSTDQTERRWSYTSGTSDTPLLGLTIGDLFDQTVEKYPDHPALISRQQNIRLTYRDLQDQVNRCAKGLMHLGFQKGQRVGIWSPNRAEWCVTQFATSKIGVILVNINPAYKTAVEEDMKADAIDWEKRIKKWNRAWKIRLIEKVNPKWTDLYDQL